MHKRRFAVLAVVVLVLGLLWYQQVAAPLDAATSLQVLDVRGDVDLIRDGGASRLESYTSLVEGDRVETKDEGEVAFGLADEATFKLQPRSALQVVSVDAGALTLSLDDGRLEATVRSTRAVRVSGGAGAVLLTDGDARFGRQRGVFQVEALRGAVQVEGDRGGLISEGEQAIITDRFATIGEVPASLLLEVDWPETRATRQRHSVVNGNTAPGARVTIAGSWGQVEVFANEEGEFEARVPLGEGDNEVEFSALDPLGRVSEVFRGQLPLRDTQGPRYRGAVDYGR